MFTRVLIFQDSLEYKRKMRPLRIRMLDGSVKTVLVDDSQNVANLMVVICTKIGELTACEFGMAWKSIMLMMIVRKQITGRLTRV